MSNLFTLAVDATSALETKYIAFLAILLPALLLLNWLYDEYNSHMNVPTVGTPPGIFGRWRAPFVFRTRSQQIINEGMTKHGNFGKPFKVRVPGRWLVLFTDPAVMNELKTLPTTVMSFRVASDVLLCSRHCLHDGVVTGAWHVGIIRKNLADKVTRELPQIVNEVLAAWEENTNVGDEWTEVNPWVAMIKTISRATNRVLLGLPLCRNDELLENIMKFSENVVSTGNLMNIIPSIFQAFTVKYLLPHEKILATVTKHLGPVFEERRRQLKDQKLDTGNAPDDAIQWILEAYPPDTPIRTLILSLLFLETTAIHTSTITVVQILYDLAANPQYQAPLKDEIEAQLHDDRGWTTQALSDMMKVDSVLRESARLNGVNIFTILRQVIIPHTFVDGTHVTKGTWVSAPSLSIHHSEKNYKNPKVFDGLRFYEMRKAVGNAQRFQNVSTSIDFLPFGDGVYACPGRFFATYEIKIILASLVYRYEFKLGDGVKRPVNIYDGIASFPDARVGILFRKRKDTKDSVLEFFSDKS